MMPRLRLNAVSQEHFLRRNAGFTLVEMLVAIAIFVILATLTLGAFKGVSKNDQISAATNQVKGWFETAKSKAIHDKLPRGVRFLPDSTNPGLCSSVAYIGSAGFDEGNLTDPAASTTQLQKCVRVVSGVGGLQVMPYIDSTGSSATVLEWRALRGTGALTLSTAQAHGLRIEIPRDSGFWYPIAGVSLANPVVLTLGRAINNYQTLENQKIDYRLELGPTVLEGDPIALPRGIVIDLDGSILPNEWRKTWTTPPAASPAQWLLSSNLDVMFSPQGTFTGQIAPRIGVLHLLISTLEDADEARLKAGGNHPQDLTTGPARTFPYSYPFVLANPKTTQKAVSVFTSSGRITTSDIFVYTYSSGTPVLFDAYANNTVNNLRLDTSTAPLLPFRNALVGKEVK
jgi:prepilin-type N-terminal cleavage/methylation domain-containing protein